MRISEVSKVLGVSKKTIYRKIDSLSLVTKGHVKESVKGKTIDKEGVELIRLSIDKGRDNDKTKADVTSELFHSMIAEQRKMYEERLDEKNQLIEDLKNDKDRLLKMQENNQILLAREQERVLLLEENTNKKGFWNRFSKKQKEENL